MIKGNIDKDFQLPDYEKHLMHVRLEVPQFNRLTGERESVPAVQTFYPAEFEAMKKAQAFAFYTVDILHDPTKQQNDIEAEDGFKKQTVNSGPTGGIVLSNNAELEGKSEAELKAIYGSFYPGEDSSKLSKKDLVAAIAERISFLKDEAAQKTLQSQEQSAKNSAPVISSQ